VAEGDHGAAGSADPPAQGSAQHRLASIQRIHDATDSLEQKIDAFERGQQELEAQKARLNELAGAISIAINAEFVALDAAA
jgi:exonuclease VII small subunit